MVCDEEVWINQNKNRSTRTLLRCWSPFLRDYWKLGNHDEGTSKSHCKPQMKQRNMMLYDMLHDRSLQWIHLLSFIWFICEFGSDCDICGREDIHWIKSACYTKPAIRLTCNDDEYEIIWFTPGSTREVRFSVLESRFFEYAGYSQSIRRSRM